MNPRASTKVPGGGTAELPSCVGVTRAYAEFFFAYNEGPLLVVNASEIDFVSNLEHRRELLSVIENARAGVSHWSRG